MKRVRVANAPLSYGAFEMTVGTSFPVPDPEQVLAAIAAAGYAAPTSARPATSAKGDVLRERLDAHGLAIVGGFVPVTCTSRPPSERSVEMGFRLHSPTAA
jgi:hypothetical protein